MTIEVEHHGDVALLRMRGGKANAMNRALLDDLDRALAELAAPALVITGDGSSFSAGLALPELIDLDRTAMSWFIDRFAAVMLRVLTYPGATVAAINGHAIAGGCVLALMCDTRVMAQGTIGLNEVQLGIGLPAIVVEPLRLRVPASSLAPVALDGALFDATRAHELGLVDHVVPRDRVESHALELAARRVSHPLAHAQVKRALLEPIVDAIERTRDAQREAWLETWFSPAAQTTLRAAVARITKR
jgi:enoyl-CoA hydratase